MSAGGQHTWSWESGQRCSSCCLGQWCPALPFLLKELIRDLEVAWGQGRGVDRVSWTIALQLLYWVHLTWVNYLAVYSEGNILFRKRIKTAAGMGDGWWTSKRNIKERNTRRQWQHMITLPCVLKSNGVHTNFPPTVFFSFWYWISHPQEVSANSVFISSQIHQLMLCECLLCTGSCARYQGDIMT